MRRKAELQDAQSRIKRPHGSCQGSSEALSWHLRHG
eukprot:CAMPEP_0174939296 /NCGR_PEP_ID=MMETSP1355-20121228/66085_1 /TAXON_ID=464990 /ORGANISM="Hemiselmis tepida, Strain CCMP443" /LENGTH=35 /DNA_ID= /DNA_START= /DNA_END= /DNA_ORIENTATION=